jgi:hypothetical protein
MGTPCAHEVLLLRVSPSSLGSVKINNSSSAPPGHPATVRIIDTPTTLIGRLLKRHSVASLTRSNAATSTISLNLIGLRPAAA